MKTKKELNKFQRKLIKSLKEKDLLNDFTSSSLYREKSIYDYDDSHISYSCLSRIKEIINFARSNELINDEVKLFEKFLKKEKISMPTFYNAIALSNGFGDEKHSRRYFLRKFRDCGAAQCINMSMCWARTPQKHDFWRVLHNKWVEYYYTELCSSFNKYGGLLAETSKM
jgi:hypothetical protein